MFEKKGLRSYFDLFLKHWKLVLLIVFLAAASAYIGSLFVTPVYQGTARLRIDLSRSSGVMKTAIGTPFFVADPFQTQVNLIRSRAISEKVVQERALNIRVIKAPKTARISFSQAYFIPGHPTGQYQLKRSSEGFVLLDSTGKQLAATQEDGRLTTDYFSFKVSATGFEKGQSATIAIGNVQDAAYQLLGQVKVLMEGPTEIMDIMVTGRTPEEAAQLTNLYARSYSDFIADMDRERSRLIRVFLEDQLKSMRAELDSLSGELAKLKKEYGIFQEDIQGSNILASMGELEKQRIELKTALRMLQSQFPDAYAAADTLGSLSDSSFNASGSELFALRTERARLREIYTPDHPALKLLDDQLKSTENTIAASRIKAYRQQLAEVNAMYNNLQAQLGEFPAKVIEIQRLQARINAGEDVYYSLLQTYYETKISEHQEYGMVVMVDSALPQPYPIQPRKKFNTMLGLLVGILLSVIAVFVLETLDITVKSKSEIEQILGVPCLSVVPKVDSDPGGQVLANEAFKLAALGLEYMNLRDGVKTVIITSPSEAEGKSSLAVGLAKSLNGMGKKVLLVDSDMRKPTLHARFNLPMVPGFSDALTNKKRFSEVIKEIDGLKLITGGTVPPDPSLLLDPENLNRLAAEFQDQLDYIIFDCPPVLPVADAIRIGKWTSAALLSVYYGKTRRDDVSETADRLKTSGVNLVGFIFNAVPLQIKRYTGKYAPSSPKKPWWKRLLGK